MSQNNFGLSNLSLRSRREGVRGTPWRLKAGIKRWLRHCAAKLERTAGKAAIATALTEAPLVEPTAKPTGTVRVMAKGQRSRKVSGQAFTSPNPYHLRQMGYSEFGSLADDRWFRMAS